MANETCDVLIVGGGPAGLRAAELVSAAGLDTVLADQMRSVGRKFLIAGRGGLNLTHSEPVENFPARYGIEEKRWRGLLADFSPRDLEAWANGLGVETFIGTSGRVFPTTKQAAPLLRRWIERLRKQGVSFRARHKLTAFRRVDPKTIEVEFEMPEGTRLLRCRTLILAMGGASWPQTGSDGAWTKLLAKAVIAVTSLAPANCGYEVTWPASFLEVAEGKPLKNIVVSAGGESVAGELLITKYGLEGGALYQLGRKLRAMAAPKLEIDLKPNLTHEQLIGKLHAAQAYRPSFKKAAQVWRLSPIAQALLQSHAREGSTEEWARLVKAFPLALRRPRPIEEAISTAGGVRWAELDDSLMVKSWPGVFCAGEMIDWDAPTGGYLLQGCFSTATRAALGAIQHLTGGPKKS
jgi:uncharacterized flavoprotein (TIGR03862 family)